MKKSLLYLGMVVIPILFFNTVKAETNLTVPFTTQSPYGHWIAPWDNACEETSTTMIDKYYQNYSSKTLEPDDAGPAIMRLVKLEDNFLGFNKDTNASQLAYIINNFLPWEAKLVENPTLEQLKHEIDTRHPIIVPVYVPNLYNPYYSNNFYYHVLVISGYDDNTKEFITQDPGTKHGLDFRYSYDNIISAIHDLLPGKKTAEGKKIAIFTNPNLDLSKKLDGDKDGLTKEQELKYGTILYFTDSDGDGHSDGQEVKNGYSPTTPAPVLLDNILVKTSNSPRVYLTENGQKRYITSEQVFLSHNWKWSDIKNINSQFLAEQISDGLEIDS